MNRVVPVVFVQALPIPAWVRLFCVGGPESAVGGSATGMARAT